MASKRLPMLGELSRLANSGRPWETLSFRPPRNMIVSRRLLLIMLSVIGLVILALGSLQTHALRLEAPKLDTSAWLRSLQAWYTGKQDQHFRKAVILASYKTQDVSWLAQLDSSLTSGWEIYRYVNDAPVKDAHDNLLTVQNTEGRETLTYLTYIVNHYIDLPDYMVFIHGHDRAWHQPESIVDKLSTLNLSAVEDEKFVSLQCHGAGCNEETMFYFDGTHTEDTRYGTKLKDFWDAMMQPRGFGDMPEIIGRPCCAQFAVHKTAVLQRNLTFWKDMQEPLLIRDDQQRPSWQGPLVSNHKIGLLYEMIWHIVFGKDPVACPSIDYCERVYFQDLLHCDKRFTGWDDREGWEDVKCTNDLRNASNYHT